MYSYILFQSHIHNWFIDVFCKIYKLESLNKPHVDFKVGGGNKDEVTNLIPHNLIDIIYKTVNPSHLEKLQLKQNVNKLIFPVIFVFSDWIFIEQIIASSTPSVLGENNFQNLPPGVLSGGLGHE